MYCWNLAWRILSISMWDECVFEVVCIFFGITFLWDWNENWPFPVLWPLPSFQNLLAYWVQHFHIIIWKYLSWNFITSTIFVHSDAFLRPTWLHIPGCLALAEWSHHHGYLGHEDFLYSSSVYSCHLLNIFCFCYVHTISVLYWAHLCMKSSLGISNILEDISSLSHLLFSSICLRWLLRRAFLSLLAILWNSAFKWVYVNFFPLPLASLLFTAKGCCFTFYQVDEDQVKWKSLSCVPLCDSMEYTVHGIQQARILQWVAVPFSMGYSQPRDWTQVSCTAGTFFTSWAMREGQEYWSG